MVKDSGTMEYGSNLMVWIWRLLIITAIVIYIYVFTATYLFKDVDITDLELNSFKERILFSSNCLAYEDSTVHPGVIDILKFDSSRLNTCFKKNKFNFELRLLDLDNNQLRSISSSPQTIDLVPLCGSISTISCSTIREYVLVKDSTGAKPMILEVVVIKNV